ncbi:two-component sensor histidine kinase [Nostoc sp. 'Peltigera membranacea cyanobiont' 213]|uniref:sensor histidine kinase n=1 Tax=unclassified Nostoc TaxID=2593658 RepID=UPI000B95C3B2|nr:MULTISPECIES: sensor histidine kinase [unclassified Nostoc]AVH64617.1 signal transduction histidine kinase [Nostoc sp. 'Peltigera membranacea cyanobiont' N6]OYD95036.1 two-component sensor histidine kinase [Nostoc sp. 'Peltigera membranacea cyanobiont' 213]
MNSQFKINKHPFPSLLYLEWILLAITALTAVIPPPLRRFHPKPPELSICGTFPDLSVCNLLPELSIYSLVIFALMGLILPTKSKTSKIIYTVVEISLILTTGLFGERFARLFPFLYIILVTRSCLIFNLPGRLFVTSLSFTLFLFTTQLKYQLFNLQASPQAQEKFRFLSLNWSLVFGLSLVFVLLMMNAVLSERHSREKLAIANEKLREYAMRIENQATLEERNRIAREIHDSLGHSLTALNLQLETALKLWQSNPGKAETFLATAKELGSKALKDVRQSVSTMRYNPLQEQSLDSAIASLSENFHRSNGILPICQINLEYSLPPEINTAIYRIIQESLTNITKYGYATEVKLELTTTRGNLRLIIQDNGRGFDLGQNTTGFGLHSMRDRTLALGGEFNINSAPGSGCKITVNIPLMRLR